VVGEAERNEVRVVAPNQQAIDSARERMDRLFHPATLGVVAIVNQMITEQVPLAAAVEDSRVNGFDGWRSPQYSLRPATGHESDKAVLGRYGRFRENDVAMHAQVTAKEEAMLEDLEQIYAAFPVPTRLVAKNRLGQMSICVWASHMPHFWQLDRRVNRV
jgi:hypothetical protein